MLKMAKKARQMEDKMEKMGLELTGQRSQLVGGSSSINMSSNTGDTGSSTQPIPKAKGSSMDKEKRIFISLTYILACYLICWTPFHVVFDILYIDESLVSTQAYAVGCIFCYLNSTVNPFLYAYSNKDFREAFKLVLTFKFLKNR